MAVIIFPSIQRKYGKVLSLKLGSYKLVVAGTPEAVKEVLVTRSADYSGRPQTHYMKKMTLGMSNATRYRNTVMIYGHANKACGGAVV